MVLRDGRWRVGPDSSPATWKPPYNLWDNDAIHGGYDANFPVPLAYQTRGSYTVGLKEMEF